MLRAIPAPLIEILRSIETDHPSTNFMVEGYCVRSSSSGRAYFVKLGEPEEEEQYNGEAVSIEHLTRAAPGLCPTVLQFGIAKFPRSEDAKDAEMVDKPFWVSDYKFMHPLDTHSAGILAKRLALELHAYRSQNGQYGFECATYCGTTRTQGKWFNTWAECFANMITCLLQGLPDDRKYYALFKLQADIVNLVIPFLLGPPLEVEPRLLHGDLWVGNVGVDNSTQGPIIYDPASYYGHNEAELSIMRMFGGFSPAFFEEYHKHRPRSKPVGEYDMRQMLYELFHYLNHTSIFRTISYAKEAERRMEALIAYVKGHSGDPRV